MVAIAIMGVLMVAVIPGFSGWLQNSQIRTAAESVQNGLQLARTEAVNRNTAVTFTLTGNDWSVDIVANATFGIAASAVQARKGTEGSRNAVITSNQNVVTFSGTGQATPTPATFNVKNSTAGACAAVGASTGARCMNVVVETGGKIRMCDPAILLANNPQGC